MNKKGYTLIELVITLTFILLLSVSAVKVYSSQIKEARIIDKGDISDERYSNIEKNVICDAGIKIQKYDKNLYGIDNHDIYKVLTEMNSIIGKEGRIQLKKIDNQYNLISDLVYEDLIQISSFYMPENYIKKDFYNYDKEGYCVLKYKYDKFEIIPFSVIKETVPKDYGMKEVMSKIKELREERTEILDIYITKKIQKNSLNNTPGEFLSKEEFLKEEAGNFQKEGYENHVNKEEIGDMYEKILNDKTKNKNE